MSSRAVKEPFGLSGGDRSISFVQPLHRPASQLAAASRWTDATADADVRDNVCNVIKLNYWETEENIVSSSWNLMAIGEMKEGKRHNTEAYIRGPLFDFLWKIKL